MTAKTDMLYNDTDLGPELSLPPVLPSAKNFQRSQSFVKPSGHDMMVRSRSFVKPSGKQGKYLCTYLISTPGPWIMRCLSQAKISMNKIISKGPSLHYVSTFSEFSDPPILCQHK